MRKHFDRRVCFVPLTDGRCFMTRKACIVLVAWVNLCFVVVWTTARSSCTVQECFESSCLRAAAGEGNNKCIEHDLTMGMNGFSTAGGGTLDNSTGNVRDRNGPGCGDECAVEMTYAGPHASANCGVQGTWSGWGEPHVKRKCDAEG